MKRVLYRPLALGALALLLGAPSAQARSPWELLSDLRNGLQEGGPVTGIFEQTYIPAGFKDGDKESGHLSMWLPSCLRWNYVKPQAKSFLLCDGVVHFWNEDESGGRRYQIDPEEEPGLDLLLVEVSKLKERYVANNQKLSDGTYEVSLASPPDLERSFSAKIRIDPVAMQVMRMEYTDEEGNLTRFELSSYNKLTHTALFSPPVDVEWTED